MAPKQAPTFMLRDPRTKKVLLTGFAFLPENMEIKVDSDSFYFLAHDLSVLGMFERGDVLELAYANGEHVAFVRVGMHQAESDGDENEAWRLGFQGVDNLDVLVAIGKRSEH